MEFQHPKCKQHTLMERIFRHCDVVPEGIRYSKKQISSLLQNIMHPKLPIDNEELEKLIAEHDRNGSGQLDFDSVTKIIFSFLMKQSIDSTVDLECYMENDLKGEDNRNDVNYRLSVDDFIIFGNL